MPVPNGTRKAFAAESYNFSHACVALHAGDPLKDTSGPSLNILIKLMAVESLVFAPFFATHTPRGEHCSLRPVAYRMVIAMLTVYWKCAGMRVRAGF